MLDYVFIIHFYNNFVASVEMESCKQPPHGTMHAACSHNSDIITIVNAVEPCICNVTVEE